MLARPGCCLWSRLSRRWGGGVGTHQASSHPVFVQGGLLEPVILPAAPAYRLAGHPTPGSQPHPDPAQAQSCSSPGPAGSGVGRGWGPHLLHMMPEETLETHTDSSVWGSETAGLPAPLCYSNPLGLPVQLSPFSRVQETPRTELGSNPCSASFIRPQTDPLTSLSLSSLVCNRRVIMSTSQTGSAGSGRICR